MPMIRFVLRAQVGKRPADQNERLQPRVSGIGDARARGRQAKRQPDQRHQRQAKKAKVMRPDMVVFGHEGL
ncbi:hypothetical protein [Paracoccus rhizosphaerae]|uniref:Uncharacterized protein n=1 Tax=Paracoccus rhizosphaerae TaxID=1133347 RepID=A0ABV6CFT3_9RHOB|nr:hypothetical protein [Paracoccus rhizosphaerae]